ncbi:MAG: serine hydrolase domain-containing protein, partial [Nakamurella sp.]
MSALVLTMAPTAAMAAPKPHTPASSTSEHSATPAKAQPAAKKKNAQGGDVLNQLIGHPARTLHNGTPAQADLVPQYANKIPVDAANGIAPGTGADGHPMYPGEVVLAARNGVIAEQGAAGFNLRDADHSCTHLPRDQWIPTTMNTIYDLASLSKVFTSIAAMQQARAGKLVLDRTVASYIPAFAANGKQGITIRQLMTHTSGLPPDPSPALWTYPTMAERVAAIYAAKPQAAPGTIYLYSDLNMMTLGKLVELVSGKTLDVAVHDGITAPLGMKDTMYNPPASLKPRIAAAEYELVPDRGLVWGQVHDENSWALGGVAGHAGVFSTTHDLAILSQTMLNGGSYGSARILSKKSVVAMMTNFNAAFPGDDHGLGFELDQHWYMGALATPYTIGHTGFTGPTLVIDPTTNSFVISLNNRVHPSRNWGSTNPVRRAVADDLARAVAVKPKQG